MKFSKFKVFLIVCFFIILQSCGRMSVSKTEFIGLTTKNSDSLPSNSDNLPELNYNDTAYDNVTVKSCKALGIDEKEGRSIHSSQRTELGCYEECVKKIQNPYYKTVSCSFDEKIMNLPGVTTMCFYKSVEIRSNDNLNTCKFSLPNGYVGAEESETGTNDGNGKITCLPNGQWDLSSLACPNSNQSDSTDNNDTTDNNTNNNDTTYDNVAVKSCKAIGIDEKEGRSIHSSEKTELGCYEECVKKLQNPYYKTVSCSFDEKIMNLPGVTTMCFYTGVEIKSSNNLNTCKFYLPNGYVGDYHSLETGTNGGNGEITCLQVGQWDVSSLTCPN